MTKARIMTKQQEKELQGAWDYQQRTRSRSYDRGSGEQKKTKRRTKTEKGKVGWILLWALGVPVPILLVLFFLRGCT
jgi:hypothetical protein